MNFRKIVIAIVILATLLFVLQSATDKYVTDHLCQQGERYRVTFYGYECINKQ